MSIFQFPNSARAKLEKKKQLDAQKTEAQATPVIISAVPALPPTPAAPQPTGDTMPVIKKQVFTYIKGTGKSDKAEYRFGTVTIPAAVITRLEAEVAGVPDSKQNHIIYAALKKKYSDFLDAVEAAEMEYSEALAAMQAIKPKKSVGTGQRATQVEKNAETFAKGIAKRFKGTPEEMVMQFQVAVATEGFKAEAIDILTSYQKQFGKGPTGYIKTSSRKGNLAAIKALALNRASKKLKK